MTTTVEEPLVEAPSPPPARRRVLERLGFAPDVHGWRESGLVVGVVGLAVVLVFKAWKLRLGLPLNGDPDVYQHAAWVKAMQQGGWYIDVPRLGAPLGATSADFPLGGESIHFAAIKLLTEFLPWGTAMNAYFFFSYFAVALSMHFTARYLRLSVWSSLVVAVLFAFLPYHQFHGVGHLLRVNYYLVAPAILVALWFFDWRTELFSRTAEGSLRLRRGRATFVALLAVLLGVSDTQHVAYASILIGFAALVAAAGARNWRPVAAAGAFVALAAATTVVANAPYLLDRIERGPNHEGVARRAVEQEIYGLRISELLLPTDDHRIPALADLADEARAERVADGEAGQNLGALGVVGLGIGLWYVARRVFQRGAEPPVLPARLGGLALVAMLTATIGGFSYLASLGGLSIYRTWGRFAVFIGALALLCLGWALDRLRARAAHRLAPRALTVASVAVAALLVAAGLFDAAIPRLRTYDETVRTFQVDADFVAAVEAVAPEGAMVFQYPIVRYPESPQVIDMPDYAHLAGFIHSDDLRWSYGGMKGRPESEWQENLRPLPLASQLAIITAVGFDGVMLNRTGLPEEGAQLDAALSALGARWEVTSRDGRLSYFTLAPVREALEASFDDGALDRFRARALEVAAVTWTESATPDVSGTSSPDAHRWLGRRGSVTIDAPDSSGSVRVRGFALPPADGDVAITAPSEAVTLAGAAGEQAFDLLLTESRRANRVTFESTGAPVPLTPEQVAYTRIRALSVLDESLDPLLAWGACRAGDAAACAEAA